MLLLSKDQKIGIMKVIVSLFTVLLSLNLCSFELVPSKNVKIVIFTPETHADIVRETMGKFGAGKIGDYDCCSFTLKGVARWRANENANPSVGEIGKFASSEEARIESICPIDLLEKMLSEVRKVHPYEEMGYDIYPLLDIK